MASKKYRFVSPGVQLRELDRSQIPEGQEPIGPVIIGRAQRGPALQPVKVGSYSEFVQIFGTPQPGGKNDDVWRTGNEGLSPQYGAYAAQAWLANSTPLTYIRLLGRAHTDAAAGGEAGWKIGNTTQQDAGGISDGGAFGLFLVDSTTGATGTLAAVWYAESGSAMVLSGTTADSGSVTFGNAKLFKNEAGSATAGTWTVALSQSTGLSELRQFNFDPTSGKFIRKVFNTNPTKLTNRLYDTAQLENYFLGETFDCDYNVNQVNSSPSSTPWILAQSSEPTGSFNPRNLKKLFKLIALEHGVWGNSHLKISIEDVNYSDDPTDEYGSFSVVVRSAKDKDSAPIVLESFANLNLNSESPDYIEARIGNQYARWDDVSRRWRYFGEYANISKYLYVDAATGLGDDPTHLPFGYQGPIRPVGINVVSGSTALTRPAAFSSSTYIGNPFSVAYGGASIAGANRVVAEGTGLVANMPAGITASFIFPATKLRANTTTGNLSDPTDAYFGVSTTNSNQRYDSTYTDLVRGLPDSVGHGEFGPTTSETANATEFSYIFTLDNVSRLTSSTSTEAADEYEAYYVSGAYAAGTSISTSGSGVTYKTTVDAGFNQFTVPMHGGIDGINIAQLEAFNNDTMGGGKTQLTSYAYNTVRIAIDTCADPENVDMNLLSAPGVTVTGLTDRVIDVCESRGDALGIIDIEGGFVPRADRAAFGNDYDPGNKGDATTAARTFKARQINNSYGATYYPWTRVKDSESAKTFFCPPSVAAVGTLSYSQEVSEVWFAPAGFNRGGLTAGAAGIPVLGVTEKLSSKERDSLYEANINPIASFPSEGLVVFGQKTTQSTRSALDRINVRRLLIFIKKEISRISNNLLFDPNTQVTWDRFTGQAVPFLESVKSRLGLEDFKVVLDNTTTTPDMVDRNIMYAKIFLKPTRAIEFIAVDFVITNTGASFED